VLKTDVTDKIDDDRLTNTMAIWIYTIHNQIGGDGALPHHAEYHTTLGELLSRPKPSFVVLSRPMRLGGTVLAFPPT
jgi:hypothetical protein